MSLSDSLNSDFIDGDIIYLTVDDKLLTLASAIEQNIVNIDSFDVTVRYKPYKPKCQWINYVL